MKIQEKFKKIIKKDSKIIQEEIKKNSKKPQGGIWVSTLPPSCQSTHRWDGGGLPWRWRTNSLRIKGESEGLLRWKTWVESVVVVVVVVVVGGWDGVVVFVPRYLRVGEGAGQGAGTRPPLLLQSSAEHLKLPLLLPHRGQQGGRARRAPLHSAGGAERGGRGGWRKEEGQPTPGFNQKYGRQGRRHRAQDWSANYVVFLNIGRLKAAVADTGGGKSERESERTEEIKKQVAGAEKMWVDKSKKRWGRAAGTKRGAHYLRIHREESDYSGTDSRWNRHQPFLHLLLCTVKNREKVRREEQSQRGFFSACSSLALLHHEDAGKERETSASVCVEGGGGAFTGGIERRRHTIKLHRIWKSRGILNREGVFCKGGFVRYLRSSAISDFQNKINGLCFEAQLYPPRPIPSGWHTAVTSDNISHALLLAALADMFVHKVVELLLSQQWQV